MPCALASPGVWTYDIGLRTRFRGLTRRQGMVWRGPAGWGEWSPFPDYSGAELVPWLRAAREASDEGWPEPVRESIPVNCTIPAVGPEQAGAIAAASRCTTAKVKVAEAGQSPAEDLDRVAAVREALGRAGRVRVDANGAWDVETAVESITRLVRFDLEYVEQPCASVEELAELRVRLARAGIDVAIAADESIRRAEDPLQVARLEAADVAVLKVQPLGGIRACLEVAEQIGLPVVVSSALETSIGIRAGIALAAALPELPYACGLNTVALLTDDLAVDPLVARDESLAVGELEVDADALVRCAADAETQRLWQARLVETQRLSEG
jgi:o-succinylbenzoate synthase